MLPLSYRHALEQIAGFAARRGMIVSDAGYVFLLLKEGYRAYLYDDGGQRGVGNATVAIGILVHLGPYHEQRGVCRECDKWPRQSDPKAQWISEARAKELLRDKANATGIFAGGQNYVGAVRAAFPNVNQNQFDAMVSYAYNYGSGAVARMARVFYAGGDMYAAFTDPRYLLPAWAAAGLLSRRRAEYVLFTAPSGPPAEEGRVYTDQQIDAKIGEVLRLGLEANQKADGANKKLDAQSTLLEVLIPPLVTGTAAEPQMRYIWAAAGKPWPA